MSKNQKNISKKNVGDNAQSQKTMIYNTPVLLKGIDKAKFLSIKTD